MKRIFVLSLFLVFGALNAQEDLAKNIEMKESTLENIKLHSQSFGELDIGDEFEIKLPVQASGSTGMSWTDPIYNRKYLELINDKTERFEQMMPGAANSMRILTFKVLNNTSFDVGVGIYSLLTRGASEPYVVYMAKVSIKAAQPEDMTVGREVELLTVE